MSIQRGSKGRKRVHGGYIAPLSNLNQAHTKNKIQNYMLVSSQYLGFFFLFICFVCCCFFKLCVVIIFWGVFCLSDILGSKMALQNFWGEGLQFFHGDPPPPPPPPCPPPKNTLDTPLETYVLDPSLTCTCTCTIYIDPRRPVLLPCVVGRGTVVTQISPLWPYPQGCIRRFLWQNCADSTKIDLIMCAIISQTANHSSMLCLGLLYVQTILY